MKVDDAALARSALRDIHGGDEAIDRIEYLERSWGRRVAIEAAPRFDGQSHDVDVIICGGGLWSILAPTLADRGLRVAVLDRGVVGRGHREWNISAVELAPLLSSGLFNADEIEALILARYDHGVCRWHEGGTYPVHGVLDHAIDGEAFLGALRAKSIARGVRVLDHHELLGLSTGQRGAVVIARNTITGAKVEITGRVVIDALGASSPHANVDLGCPTVGGVLSGLAVGDRDDEINPRVGDILVTTEHRDDGRQHIWEGFPGSNDRYTTYVFHYARAAELPPQPLLSLYGRFFRLRSRYKRGASTSVTTGEGGVWTDGVRLDRLTYGIIPGWSRLTPAPAASVDGLLLVGDAAARHSPLTFCGFGSMVRSFLPIANGLEKALDRGDLSSGTLSSLAPEPQVLAGVGALALLLAKPRRSVDPAATNRLLDAAFKSLYEAGEATYSSLLQDRMSARTFASFLLSTSRIRTEVYRDTWSFLSPREFARWARHVAHGYTHAT